MQLSVPNLVISAVSLGLGAIACQLNRDAKLCILVFTCIGTGMWIVQTRWFYLTCCIIWYGMVHNVKAGVYLGFVQFKEMRNQSVQLQWKSALPDPVVRVGLGSLPRIRLFKMIM